MSKMKDKKLLWSNDPVHDGDWSDGEAGLGVIKQLGPEDSNYTIVVTPTSAAKNDKSKPDLSLLPKVFLNAVAEAMMVGEQKYGRYNYTKGHKTSQLIAAAMRHLSAYYDGEERDPIDGQLHLGSVAACVLMLLRQQELCTLTDDRFKNENK